MKMYEPRRVTPDLQIRGLFGNERKRVRDGSRDESARLAVSFSAHLRRDVHGDAFIWKGTTRFVCVRAVWKETETIAFDDLVTPCGDVTEAGVCRGRRMVWWWTSSSWVSTRRAFGRCARGRFEEDGECAVGFRASDRTRLARVGGFGEMEGSARARPSQRGNHADEKRAC